MNLIKNIFRRPQNDTASIARDRLQIIVAHRRKENGDEDFIPKLQKELIEVIKKYVHVDEDQVNVALDKSNNQSRLELNINLPELVADKA